VARASRRLTDSSAEAATASGSDLVAGALI
jgi:hypothetical protein